MPLLNEYLKLRTEQARELSWGELDENFLYVANPWSPQRMYKEGNIVYYYVEPTTANSFVGGYSWYVAKNDHGPSSTFNLINWDPIGAASNSLSVINVVSGTVSSSSIDTLNFSDTDFDIAIVGSTAAISINPDLFPYWLTLGNAGIGSGLNNSNIMHTGNVIIGSGSQSSSHKLTVYGTTNITGALTVGGTINTVNVLSFYNAYTAHTHTIIPTSYGSYALLYPDSISSLADFNINTGTLANGDTLVWNATSKKWVNTAISSSSLAGLSDVTITTASDNQLLRYEAASGKWKNITVTTDGSTGFSTAPFSHNHDTVYYTKTQLQTSGLASVHWNNLSNLPTDNAEYIVAATPGSSPFSKPNHRVIGSSDNSITITTASNLLDLSVNTLNIPTIVYFDQNGLSYSTGNGIDFIDTDSNIFTLSTITSGTIGVEAESRHQYYLDNTSISNRPSVEYLTPTQPPAASQPNVWFDITDNPNSNNRTQITAIARTPISINNSIQPDARQIIELNNTATIGWSITDNGAGSDSVTITADYIGITGDVEILYNNLSQGNFNTLNFTNTGNINWSFNPTTGGLVDLTATATQDLQSVTDNDNTTTNNIEITTAANVSTGVGGIVLLAPNGTSRYLLTVDNSGNLITTLLP